MKFDAKFEQEDRRSEELMRVYSLAEVSENDRHRIMQVLGYRDGKEELELALIYAKSDDCWDRSAAAVLFGWLGGEKNRPLCGRSRRALEKLLEDSHDGTVAAALCAMQRRGAKDIVDLLRQFEHDSRRTVRCAVALGMTGTGEPEFFLPLTRLAEDKKSDVRECALLGIASFDEIFPQQAEEMLWRHLKDRAVVPRSECFGYLASNFTVTDEERDEELNRKKIERLVLALLKEWDKHPIHLETLYAAFCLEDARLKRRLDSILIKGQAFEGVDDETWSTLKDYLNKWSDPPSPETTSLLELSAMLRRTGTVQTRFQKVAIWKSPASCEFRVAGAIHAWWHAWLLLTGLAWDNLAAGALLRPAGPPKSILMLGLAGGTAMRILRHLLPDCRFVAVDIDAEIVALAREHMHLDNLNIEVHLADAYEWCATCKERFDVVIDDIYLAGKTDVFRPDGGDGGQIGILKRLLKPGGIVLANLVNGPGHRTVQSRTRAAFRAAFPVVRSVTTPASMNETLVGGSQVLARAALDQWRDLFPQEDDRDLWKLLRVRPLPPLRPR